MIFVILSKLTETIVHLCCKIFLLLFDYHFSDRNKAALVWASFQFQISRPPSDSFSILFFTFLDHPIHLKGINESMQSNPGLPNTHSLSAYCSVTAVGCCQFLQTTAIYSADWFISSVSPPPSIPPSRTPHTQRACAPGQDSGHCAQLSSRVASESAGCDFRLARVIIILSYMGIIREAIISQYSHILFSFQSNWWKHFEVYEDCLMIGHL